MIRATHARVEIKSYMDETGGDALLRVRFHVKHGYFDGYAFASDLEADDPAELKAAIEAAPVERSSLQELLYALSCVL